MSQYLLLFSATGRTERVAQIVANAWGGTWEKIDLSVPAAPRTFSREDLCIVAVSVYEGRVPTPAVGALKQFTGGGAQAVLLAVFGNRAVDDCLLELRELMTAQEFRCGAAVEAVSEHSIFPRYGAGRPDEQDRRELADFTAHIKAAYEAGTLPERVEVPGKVPYAEMGGVPLHPRAGRACVSCGLCAQRCPVGAIPAENPKLTDKDKCITCMRCITICPHGARALSPKPLAAVGERLMAKALGGHKGNTLYLKG